MKKFDKQIAIAFGIMTALFLVLLQTNASFMEWTFERHHNQMSWFIRPLFLIPFCYFAYKHSWAGISFTTFCLFTSMFWFNPPETVPDNVQSFLEFEKAWLDQPWNFNKVLLLLTVPLSFLFLGLAFWKRSLWMGLSVVILMAVGKITWSILNAGESGKSILIPAIIGLLVCIGLIFLVFKQLEKSKTTSHASTKKHGSHG